MKLPEILETMCSVHGKTKCSCCRETRDWVEVFRNRNGELLCLCSRCMNFIEKLVEDIK